MRHFAELGNQHFNGDLAGTVTLTAGLEWYGWCANR